MRVAFDIDGVFADMNAGLARIASDLFPIPDSGNAAAATAVDPTPGRLAGAPDPGGSADSGPGRAPLIAPRQQARVWERVRSLEDFWETLDEMEPGAVARLAAIAERRQWHVLFLTQRPETAGRPAQVQSQRWLQRRGFELPSVCITKGSRGRIAEALHLDAVVDDRRDNCLDIRGASDARVILVERSDDATAAAKAARLGLESVPGVMAALDLLERAAA